LADSALDRNARALVTPEGVDLRVRLATVSERAVALMIDMGIMIGFIILLVIAVVAAGSQTDSRHTGEVVSIIWLLGWFVLRNFYFTLFECSARAATPGKRIMRLRVAARSGKALSADAVVARNAMRELELYLPLTFLLIASFGGDGDVGSWMILLGLIWCFVFALFPMFNRDHLRVGDVVAGTWVLRTPKHVLLPDLAEESVFDHASIVFSEAQLDVYGVKELQVLEKVLRIEEPQAMAAVAERIKVKINWQGPRSTGDGSFLTAYYQALRRRLEQRLLFGVRKKDKHDIAR
jgi:uncharacterized RDD family membrane protein YckC